MANTNRSDTSRLSKNTVVLCSINISGMSERSRTMLDNYCDKEQIDILLVQETGSSNKTKLKLTNMKLVTDTHNSVNRGAALYVRGNLSLTNLTELSGLSKELDSA